MNDASIEAVNALIKACTPQEMYSLNKPEVVRAAISMAYRLGLAEGRNEVMLRMIDHTLAAAREKGK